LAYGGDLFWDEKAAVISESLEDYIFKGELEVVLVGILERRILDIHHMILLYY
jgi:hypothetical protein